MSGNTKYEKEKHKEGEPFFPNFFIEDLRTVALYLLLLAVVVIFFPNLFFTKEAFIPANPLSTPAHIKPEWYFLASYQVLKLFPTELAGVLAQGIVVMLIFLLPFIDQGPRKHFLNRPIFTTVAVLAILIFILLSIWGHFS